MVYEEIISTLESGGHFEVNFEEKYLKVNGKVVLDETHTELDVPCAKNYVAELEDLYHKFRYSKPGFTEKEYYFVGLPDEELSEEDKIFGKMRIVAQFELEIYILKMILDGVLWSDWTSSNWFYQGKDKTFIILRSWYETNKGEK